MQDNFTSMVASAGFLWVRAGDAWEIHALLICHQPEEIEQVSSKPQVELEALIQEKSTEVRQMRFEHFDEDVHKYLKFFMESTKKQLDDVLCMFWALTKYIYFKRYRGNTDCYKSQNYFNDERLIFCKGEKFIHQEARLERHNEVPIYYHLDINELTQFEKEAGFQALMRQKRSYDRSEKMKIPLHAVSHHLSNFHTELVFKGDKDLDIQLSTITFNLAAYPHRIALLEEQISKSSWLSLYYLTMETFEAVEYLLFILHDEDSATLRQEVGEKLFLLRAMTTESQYQQNPYQKNAEERIRLCTTKLLQSIEINNHIYFSEELDKLDSWAEDFKNGLELELKKIDKDICELDRQSKQMVRLQEKLECQKQKAVLEKHCWIKKLYESYNSKMKSIKSRDTLIKQIEKQMQDT